MEQFIEYQKMDIIMLWNGSFDKTGYGHLQNIHSFVSKED